MLTTGAANALAHLYSFVFQISLSSLPYPKLKNHYPSGPAYNNFMTLPSLFLSPQTENLLWQTILDRQKKGGHSETHKVIVCWNFTQCAPSQYFGIYIHHIHWNWPLVPHIIVSTSTIFCYSVQCYSTMLCSSDRSSLRYSAATFWDFEHFFITY